MKWRVLLHEETESTGEKFFVLDLRNRKAFLIEGYCQFAQRSRPADFPAPKSIGASPNVTEPLTGVVVPLRSRYSVYCESGK